MKRGIDDDKNMGPMFPRLHVNDTEKGGPRAPPRNKMALYEQLSIPSQRFNSGRPTPNHSNSRNLASTAPSNQGTDHDRRVFSSLSVPPLIPTLSEKSHIRHTEAINSTSPLTQLEQIKETRHEDDCSVPIFVHAETGQTNLKKHNSIDRGKMTPLSPSCTGHSTKNNQNSAENDLSQMGSLFSLLGQNRRNQDEINLKQLPSSGGLLVKSSTSRFTREKINGSMKQASREHLTPNLSLIEGNKSPEDTVYGEYLEENTRGSELTGIAERCDDISEASMVDAVDISPDDVVGIIGQKHFWKARRAIVNQQRVFAVQVFELHRLIKVQRLMAGSPHLLIEDGSYLDKPSMKVAPIKQIAAKYSLEPPPHPIKHKAALEKQNHNFEHSSENAIGKASALSSEKNLNPQSSPYAPYIGKPSPSPSPSPMATDPNMAPPWPIPQPSGHQWLVPIMSPSEGLIYKPYPAPGFMGPTFPNPGYGSPPMIPPMPHGYFPPYGMQVMSQGISGSSVEQQANRVMGPTSKNQLSEISGGADNFTAQNQSSCSMTSQKSRAISRILKIPATKTSSTPSKRVHSQSSNDKNALPLFPTTPPVLPHDTEKTTRAIRVVPHNAMTATESAARIFQSIQEERKQLDST